MPEPETPTTEAMQQRISELEKQLQELQTQNSAMQAGLLEIAAAIESAEARRQDFVPRTEMSARIHQLRRWILIVGYLKFGLYWRGRLTMACLTEKTAQMLSGLHEPGPLEVGILLQKGLGKKEIDPAPGPKLVIAQESDLKGLARP